MSPKTADFFRALDDSTLSPYEVRFLVRVWRRGKCWEKLESIAKSTSVSVGKTWAVRRDLLAAGWLVESVYEGRVVYEVAIPDYCSVSCGETEFHEVKPEFHQVKPEFHVVQALPINRQNEDHNTKLSARGGGDDDEQLAKERAISATLELIEFWEQLTKRKAPPVEAETFRENWFKPFNQIWITCGRSVDAAKAKVQAVRDSMLGDGRRIFDPSKLPAHVQAMVDAELLPLTQRMNGKGAALPVVQMVEIAPGLY